MEIRFSYQNFCQGCLVQGAMEEPRKSQGRHVMNWIAASYCREVLGEKAGCREGGTEFKLYNTMPKVWHLFRLLSQCKPLSNGLYLPFGGSLNGLMLWGLLQMVMKFWKMATKFWKIVMDDIFPTTNFVVILVQLFCFAFFNILICSVSVSVTLSRIS